jgi:hypothetical protein
MNEEQVREGRNALIALGWESESINTFARITCNNEIKKEISSGLLPYLNNVVNDLGDLQADLNALIVHIQEFNNG